MVKINILQKLNCLVSIAIKLKRNMFLRIGQWSVIRGERVSPGAITQPFGMESNQTKINMDESGQMTIIELIGLSTLRVCISANLILDKLSAHRKCDITRTTRVRFYSNEF